MQQKEISVLVDQMLVVNEEKRFSVEQLLQLGCFDVFREEKVVLKAEKAEKKLVLKTEEEVQQKSFEAMQQRWKLESVKNSDVEEIMKIIM